MSWRKMPWRNTKQQGEGRVGGSILKVLFKQCICEKVIFWRVSEWKETARWKTLPKVYSWQMEQWVQRQGGKNELDVFRKQQDSVTRAESQIGL